MYLHLGGEICVRIKDIVAIMDLETSSTSKITREFLRKMQKNGEVININDEELPKSYVVTEENKFVKMYISPISSNTLLKRANNLKTYFSMF